MGEDGDRGGGGLGSLPPEPPGPSPRLAPPLFPHQERALSRQGSIGSDASGGSTPTASGGGREPRATAFGSTGATPPHLAGAPFMGNPLYESSPSDARGVSGVIGGGVRKAGGIGLSQKEAPESHLRKAKAGGLLTKLPFGATASATARPKIRFFRVTPDGRELQWGDPRDAAKPALPSRLALADVSAVVVGHDTAAFERFKRRAAPPAMCFSLVCDARTVDLFAGTPNEAAQWSGALDHLARLARESNTERRPSDVERSNDTIGQHKQTPGLARTSSNASQQSQGSTGDPSSSVKRSAPVRFTPAPRSDADVALDFVPMASQPPTPDGHVSLDLRDGIERDGGWGTRGVVYGAGVVTGGRAVDDTAGGRTNPGSRSERVPEHLTGSALEPVAPAFATTTQLAAGAARWRERAARGAVDPGVSEGRRGAGARGRAAGKTAGEDVVEAFSRARHGRTKELDKLFQLERVDPAVRDQHGLTLLHIAAQNNQRKAAKLVLKRTDFATDPPRLSLIDAQTSAGHTALHFAFAYGYKELGKYLLSLGADDTVANVHGMTCYEGLDPDEPPRDCLNTPEMRELARSAELRRRVDAMRPGAGAGAGGGLGLASSRGGTITHPLGRPSGVAGLARDSGAFTARGGAGSGTAPSSSRGGGGGWEGSEYDVGSEYGVAYPYTPRDVPGYGPGNGPGNGPGAYGGGHPGYPPNPYAAPGAVAPPPPPYPAYPPTLTPGFHSGYNPMDPMGAAAFAAQQQMAAAAAMAAQMQAMQMSSPAGSMGSTHSPMGSHSHGSHGASNLGGSMPTGFQPNRSKAHPAGGTVSSRGSAVGGGGVASSGASAATNRFSRGDVESDEPPEPPSPIMGPGRKGSSHRSGGRHDAEAAWERALDSRRRRKSDSSNLDSSDDDEFEVNKKQQQKKQQQQREQREREQEENKRPHPRRRAGAEASARVAAAGGRRGDRAARDEALDREAALRAAALRKHGYHSSDSDSPTSASEAESSRRRAPAPRSVVAGSNPPPGAVVGPGRRERAERSRAAAVDGPGGDANIAAGEDRDAGGEDRDIGRDSSREIRDIDVAAREEAARVREEKRRQRAGAMRGATAVGETGRASCLPARTASKIAMVLGAHPRADPRSVRDVLATGSLDASAGGVTLEALRAIRTVVPTPADIATCRATHGMGAAADAKMASAALADRFVHEMARVHRADAKLDAIILRETFADRADDLETALVLVKDASERACRSDALGRLLDIVVALSAILEKEETGKAAGGKPGDARSRYKLASLARLATVPAKSSAGDRTNGLGGDTLLHHLSKTVEAKAGAGDVLRWAESSGEGFRKASAASAPAEVRERVAELRRAVRDVEAEAAACERDSQRNGGGEDVNSRLAASLRAFAAEARVRLDVLWATSEAADESAARLLVAFGPAPKGTAPGDVLRTLGEFAEAFERATAENRRARMERGKE